MAEPRWFLTFAWGKEPYALDLPEITIGRGDGCPLQLEEAGAADEHARVIVDEDEQVFLEPLAPGQPTLMNGRAISARVKLADGDSIQIGGAVLTLRASSSAPVAGKRPPASSSPDARTLAASELPDEVRRAIAEREPRAKNFVIGEQRPMPLATVMMESPLREHMPTLMGVGLPPRELASAPTMMGAALPVEDVPAARTMIATAPTVRDVPAAAATILAAHTAQLATEAIDEPRPRGHTQSDITPLPLPLPPPTSSIANLQSLVQASTQLRPAARNDFANDDAERTRTDKKLSERSSPPHSTALPDAATQQRAAVAVDSSGKIATGPVETIPDAPALQRTDATPASKSGAGPRAGAAHDPRAPYEAPAKGAFGSFSRASDFFRQMMSLARQERTLLKPILWDLAIATPVSLLVSLLLLFVDSPGAVYLVLSIGVALLYFIDYACNALTASLMYDYVTTGRADLPAARARVQRSLSGILIFAAVSALLDVASTYARERRDVLSKILLSILRAIWTTATYVILPALIIEGVSFKSAFARSKKLMEHDPTGVGAGVVALSLCSYLCAAIVFPLAFVLMRVGSHVHPILGVLLFFALVNLYWSISGWLKISYSTCFYLWAQRCAAEGRAEPALAPLPLRHAMDAG